jgi:hypothetical protein
MIRPPQPIPISPPLSHGGLFAILDKASMKQRLGMSIAGKPLFRRLHGNRHKAADVQRQLCPLDVNSIIAEPGLDEKGM